ncbi:MAG: M56 family metallopeptidase [Verrucomicrobia bacterium]|nr:M56 family metallopeptidase [Verrucomicrobiota bacterium]
MIGELINHLWQSTLFALAACCLIILFRKGSSWSRHFIAWTAIIKFLIPFSVLGWVLPFSTESESFWKFSFLSGVPELGEKASLTNFEYLPLDIPMEAVTPEFPWTTFIIFAWLCGFTILFTRRWVQYLRCKRSIAATSRPADKGWQNLAQLILGNHEHTPPKIVLSADENLHAGVFGLVNTTIVIPEKMDKAFGPSDREAFLRHELQHVLKKDNLWLFIQKCIRDLLWFHPLAYWLDMQISSEREMMRDEEVLQKTNNIKSYINCLMKASNIELPSSYATSVGLKGSPFARRLKAIASYKSNVLKKLISATASVTTIIALAIVFLVSTSPVQAQDDDAYRDEISVKELLRKHQELQARMEESERSLNNTAEEYAKVQMRLRKALMNSDNDGDLSPDELGIADQLLARWQDEMEERQIIDDHEFLIRWEDENREDLDRADDLMEVTEESMRARDILKRKKLRFKDIHKKLRDVDSLSEERELSIIEQHMVAELKSTAESLHRDLAPYLDDEDENEE